MSQPTSGLCHTPRSFSEAFPALLASHYPTVVGVTLTLAPSPHRTAGFALGHAAPDREGHGQHDELVTVLVSFYGRAREAESVGTSPSSPPLLSTCVVAAHASSLTAAWCARLQRTFSIASVLQTECADGLEDGCGLEELHVLLYPFVPEMHYTRSLDGILGSQHYCAVSGTVQCGASAATLSSRPSTQEREKERRSFAAAVDGGEDWEEEGADVGGAAAEAAERPEKQRRTECTGRILRESPLPFAGPGAFDCRVAALLNANIPDPPDADARGGVAEAESFLLVILHAPGRSLATSNSIHPGCPTASRRPQQDGVDAVLFDSMKAFTTRSLAPRLNLAALRGAWHPPSALSVPPLPPHDDVCGLSALGTSYRVYPLRKAQDCGRVRNVVLVLDIPVERWRQLLAGLNSSASTAATEAGGWVEEAAAEVAALLDAALLRLASENVDLFAFRQSAAAAAARGDGVAAAPARGAVLSDDVMIRSIAESVVRIIYDSQSADFVRAAEDIVRAHPSQASPASFAATPQSHDVATDHTPSAQLPEPPTPLALCRDAADGPVVHRRLTAAEMRWAIEERLHSLRMKHQQK